MNFGRGGNFFEDNRRGFGNFDSNPPSFSRGFSNSNFGGSGITRQRSPLFDERDHFDSVSTNSNANSNALEALKVGE